ncbi:hypothetical protein pb186bvf_000877 [Paramecium bursaria]
MNYDYEPFQFLSDMNFKRINPIQNTLIIQDLQFEDLYNFKTNFQSFQVQEIMQSFNIDDLIDDQQALLEFETIGELKQNKKKLSREEKNLFKWIFMKLYEIQPFSVDLIVFIVFTWQPSYIWHKISSLLNRPLDQLKQMRENIEKKTVHQFPWSDDEDLHLENIVKYIQSQSQSKQGGSNYKIKWKKVSEELKLLTKTQHIRLPRQCRERWINHLSPDINKNAWSQIEAIQLIDLVKEIGKKWSQIARILNRNDNQVKNKYNAITKNNRTSEKQQNKLQNSMNSISNSFLEQTCPPDLNIDYKFGFANLLTKTVYLFDQNQFLLLLKKMDSLKQSCDNRVISEQDIFTPFYSDYKL